jgi:polysaccharide export outer membrane protein
MLITLRKIFGALAIGFALLLPAIAQNGGGVVGASDNYVIGPGDVIDVVVVKNETLSRAGLRVSNQGTIQLPMFDDDVPAACMTERELADSVKERYKRYLLNPYVNVAVREFNSNPVAVIGAVNSPGRFQLQRSIRLAELLTYVNGPSAIAGDTVEIIRSAERAHCRDGKLVKPEGAEDELLSVSLDDTFKQGEAANPLILAGDIVRLTEANQENAYIQGNVKSAMAINLKDPVSLTQAVAMAGGLAPGAQTEKVKIRRQKAGSINREEIIVNLKAINKQEADDILLVANDIVEVPGPSGGKKILTDIFKTLVPSITRFPVGIIP